MRFLFILLLLCSLSCNKSKSQKETSLLSLQIEKSYKSAHLTKDDALILEVSYPVILNKIVACEPLGPKDVIVLYEIGISVGNLIHIIKYTNSNFTLSTDDVVELQLSGVPFEVINFMIDS
jgi:hypothetical protein